VGLTLIAKRPLLQLLQLKPFKTREGVMEPISITYTDNGFQLLDNDFVQPEDPAWKAVMRVHHRGTPSATKVKSSALEGTVLYPQAEEGPHGRRDERRDNQKWQEQFGSIRLGRARKTPNNAVFSFSNPL
jgi:hypothetical protein